MTRMCCTSRTLFLSLALSALPGLAAAESPAVVGRVAALFGNAVAEREGQPPRPLGCRDRVYQGERVVTAESSRVGLLLGDVLAHLAESSALRVGLTPDEVADMTLEAGGVRVIDPRDSGARARLAALDAGAQVLGNDAEAYIFEEKTGPYAMLCEWDAPLPVARGPERAVAEPGRCVIAKRREPLYLADAHQQRLGSPGQDACSLGTVVGSLGDHFMPDVAAGPGPGGPSLPGGPRLPRRSPCDDPGSVCPTGGGGPIPILGLEPPPTSPGPTFPGVPTP